METITGTGVALITPFNLDGSVDFESLESLVNYVIENGVEYLVLLGTTAETATLSKEEKKEVVEKIKQVNDSRVPMVLGIGGNNTKEVIETIQSTEDLEDYAAILSVSPYYNRPTQEGIYQHYKAVAESTKKEIILYNVPSRTGSNIEPETTLRLANDFKNIVAIKEAAPSFMQSVDILEQKPEEFLVISGNDDFALPMTLAGGKGVISVIGQGLAKEFSEMIREGLQKQTQTAYQAYYALAPSMRDIFKEGNPAGIKALLKQKGVIKEQTVRLPLIEASKELNNTIKLSLQALEQKTIAVK